MDLSSPTLNTFTISLRLLPANSTPIQPHAAYYHPIKSWSPPLATSSTPKFYSKSMESTTSSKLAIGASILCNSKQIASLQYTQISMYIAALFPLLLLCLPTPSMFEQCSPTTTSKQIQSTSSFLWTPVSITYLLLISNLTLPSLA